MIKSKQKIWLIEDELDIMYINKTALAHAGFLVEGMSTGKETMEKLKKVQEKKEENPSLVLLDLALPDINGLEVLRAIRENDQTKNLIVFILSNYTSDSLQNMQYIKPDKCLLKSSITPTELADMVTKELDKKD